MYILEEGTEDIIPEEIISDEARSRVTQAFSRTIEKVTEAASLRQDIPPEKLRVVIERASEFRNVVDVDHVTSEITSVVDEILDSSAQILNQTLIKSRTGYRTEHAVDTTLVTLLIARHLLYSRRDLVEIGTGAFLHDLGKLAFPTLIAKPAAEYTDDERFLMREHPVFGQQLLSHSTDRLFMAQTTILHHHERQDGLGYPLGLRGRNEKPYLNGHDTKKYIFPFAEILAVANVYDNYISHHNQSPLSPEAALVEILRRARTVFNSEVVALLAKVISIFPVGGMVSIVDCSNPHLIGMVGAVMKSNSERPHYPIVVLLRDAQGRKITPKTVDLTSEKFVRLDLVQ
ncbi:HD domain-containing protein [candidate division KSB1 bacterium]|nr:MAG: HD domain-containing protein [candidate division KSB1 bacterium]